jgi:hypothetical protein
MASIVVDGRRGDIRVAATARHAVVYVRITRPWRRTEGRIVACRAERAAVVAVLLGVAGVRTDFRRLRSSLLRSWLARRQSCRALRGRRLAPFAVLRAGGRRDVATALLRGGGTLERGLRVVAGRALSVVRAN